MQLWARAVLGWETTRELPVLLAHDWKGWKYVLLMSVWGGDIELLKGK